MYVLRSTSAFRLYDHHHAWTAAAPCRSPSSSSSQLFHVYDKDLCSVRCSFHQTAKQIEQSGPWTLSNADRSNPDFDSESQNSPPLMFQHLATRCLEDVQFQKVYKPRHLISTSCYSEAFLGTATTRTTGLTR